MKVVEREARAKDVWIEKASDWEYRSVTRMWDAISEDFSKKYCKTKRKKELQWTSAYNKMSRPMHGITRGTRQIGHRKSNLCLTNKINQQQSHAIEEGKYDNNIHMMSKNMFSVLKNTLKPHCVVCIAHPAVHGAVPDVVHDQCPTM